MGVAKEPAAAASAVEGSMPDLQQTTGAGSIADRLRFHPFERADRARLAPSPQRTGCSCSFRGCQATQKSHHWYSEERMPRNLPPMVSPRKRQRGHSGTTE